MKNFYATCLFFIASIFIANAQNTCSPLITSGLIAYYPFCGNANDTSGNGNHGTVVVATLTTDRFGNANSAYAFDGTSNYISIPELTNSSINSFSISLWLSDLQITAGFNGFYHGAAAGEWAVYNNGMGVHLNDGIWYTATFNNLDSAWTHYVGIYNKGIDIKVYLNGQLAAQLPIPNNDLYLSGAYHSTIGAYNSGSSNFWNGKIDDAYIYNRELTLSEIDSLYHEGGWVGINEIISSRDITIYPKLSTGRFIVKCSNTIHNPTIKIFNALGDVVYYSAINNPESEIDLSNRAKGIYFVQVTSGTENWTEKVLIE
jgi:hypothetical protein